MPSREEIARLQQCGIPRRFDKGKSRPSMASIARVRQIAFIFPREIVAMTGSRANLTISRRKSRARRCGLWKPCKYFETI